MKQFYIFLFSVLSLGTLAQVPFGYSQNSHDYGRIPKVQVADFNADDLWSLAHQSDKDGTLPIYGKEASYTMTPSTHGVWTYLPNGDKVWQIRVTSPGALSMDVWFSNFYVPEGAFVYAYSADRSWFVGPYGSEENSPVHTYRTPEVFGEDIVFEYYQPYEVMENPILDIRGFGHFFRFVHDDRFERASDVCEVDVKCPEGDEWANEIRSVVRLSIPSSAGVGLCSGTLVNNTAYDCKNYILTADHCTQDSQTSDFALVSVRFNYQKNSCGSGVNASTQNKVGTYRRADSNDGGGASGSDFCLLEMVLAIPSTYNPYYAGWDATGAAPTLSASNWRAIGIHHPAGDYKKISTASNCTASTWPGGAANHHWKITWMQTVTNWGVTEGGSSGSAIFDKNHHQIGTLTGGGSFCDTPTANDYYGRMDKHFTSNPNPANEDLVDWLDAAGTGLLVIDGSYVGTSSTQPCSSVGIEESVAFQDLKLFPTQVVDFMQIQCARFDLLKAVHVYSQDGKLVHTFSLNTETTTIDLSGLAQGMYFVSVIRKDGSAFNKKFVKL